MSGPAIQRHGLVRNLQSDIAQYLQADEQLFAPPRTAVIIEDIGSIESEVEKAIGGLASGGVCVIVGCPQVAPADPKRPFMFSVTILIQCIEISIINRSTTGNREDGERIAEIVFGLLQNWQSDPWTPLLRSTWESGEMEDGNLGDRMTFSAMACYEWHNVLI